MLAAAAIEYDAVAIIPDILQTTSRTAKTVTDDRVSRKSQASQSVGQDFLEQFLGRRNLDHLENDVAAIAQEFGVDLDELSRGRMSATTACFFSATLVPDKVGEIVRSAQRN